PPAGGEVNADAALAAARLAADPAAGLSRLLCPRQLAAGTRYLACVVPTFMAGRVAGLGGRPEPAAQAGPASGVRPGGEGGPTLPALPQLPLPPGRGGALPAPRPAAGPPAAGDHRAGRWPGPPYPDRQPALRPAAAGHQRAAGYARHDGTGGSHPAG